MSKDAKLIGAKLLSLAGDSSFDFALPLAIVAFSPDSTLLAGVFIAARKLLYIFLLPTLSRLLDRTPAMTAMTAILASQVIAISLITLVFSQLVGHTVTSLTTGPTLSLADRGSAGVRAEANLAAGCGGGLAGCVVGAWGDV